MRKSICTAAAVLAGAVGLTALYRKAKRPKAIGEGLAKFRVRYFAHRGLHDEEIPENSMAAFALAADAGYGIELDVNLDGDGEVVVFHDDDLERMTGYRGHLNDTPSNVLKTLRLNGTQQGIPTLSKVLQMTENTPLIIELKTTTRYRELCEKTLALLDAYAGDYVIESFDPRIVAWFSRHVPYIVRGQLVQRAKGTTSAEYAKFRLLQAMLTNGVAHPQFIACEASLMDTRAIRACKRAGAAIAVWTVRSAEEEQRIADADAVIFEGYRP
ncbi:MAG: glycerophosphodiester phosphodiesterase [Clostridia bacterium]|nr:glycerophosphodiester phosphodiesterase [Clostridia bacterium]